MLLTINFDISHIIHLRWHQKQEKKLFIIFANEAKKKCNHFVLTKCEWWIFIFIRWNTIEIIKCGIMNIRNVEAKMCWLRSYIHRQTERDREDERIRHSIENIVLQYNKQYALSPMWSNLKAISINHWRCENKLLSVKLPPYRLINANFNQNISRSFSLVSHKSYIDCNRSFNKFILLCEFFILKTPTWFFFSLYIDYSILVLFAKRVYEFKFIVNEFKSIEFKHEIYGSCLFNFLFILSYLK